MGSQIKHAKRAKLRGEARRRRRKRAEHREATKQIREARNTKMRAESHPGWVPQHLEQEDLW
jgi:hypothetical protein